MPILGSNTTSTSTWTYNVKDYGAKGDNSTDDTVSIQAAVNALKATTLAATSQSSGQQLFFPPGFYKTTAKLDFTGLAQVHIKGYDGRGGWRNPAAPGTCINYIGGGTTTAIDMGGSQGVVWDGVSLWANSASYSGVLLNLDTVAASDVYGHRIQNCQLRAVSGASAVLLSMAGNIEVSVDNVTFHDAGATGTQVRMVNLSAPAHWSNANSFRSCSFIGQRQYSILDPAHQNTLIDCTFEASGSGAVPAPIAFNHLGNEPASGLTLIGCGFWDNTATTGAWITSTVATDSFAIIGGTMTVGTSGLSLSSHTGLSIQGMRFDRAAATGTPNVFDPAYTITNGSLLGCKVVTPVVDNHTTVFA